MVFAHADRRWLGVLVFFCVLNSPALGASGTEGAAFLDIPVGAGPASLGSAYTALATDAYAPTSNPAGLAFLDSTEVAGQHLSYLQSIRYEHLNAVVPLSRPDAPVRRGLGIAIQDLGSGDIARTDVQNGSPVTGLGNYSSRWSAYSLSYGQTLTDRWAIGLTGKVIHASIDDLSATAYGVDAGTLYRWNDRLTCAATLANAGTPLSFLQSRDPLPLTLRTGAAYRFSSHWTWTAESWIPRTGLVSGHMGGEWRPLANIALRAGYKTDTLRGLDAAAGMTFGMGLTVWGHELAYAWLPYGDLGNAQLLSLRLRFGPRENEARHVIAHRPPARPEIEPPLIDHDLQDQEGDLSWLH